MQHCERSELRLLSQSTLTSTMEAIFGAKIQISENSVLQTEEIFGAKVQTSTKSDPNSIDFLEKSRVDCVVE